MSGASCARLILIASSSVDDRRRGRKIKGDGGKSALSADVSLHLEEAPRASADFPRKFWYFCFQKYPRGRREKSLERSSEKNYVEAGREAVGKGEDRLET